LLLSLESDLSSSLFLMVLSIEKEDFVPISESNLIHSLGFANSPMSSAVASLPSKKRKHSTGSANGEEQLQNRKASVDSAEADVLMGSLASDDTAAMALRAFADGGSIVGSNTSSERKPLPPKKRKASFDSTFGYGTKRKASFSFDDTRRRAMSMDSQAFENESAFGLVPLGSVTGSTGSVEDHMLKGNPSHDNISINSESHSRLPPLTSKALEHLDALGDDGASLGLNKDESKRQSDDDEESSAATMASSNQRILLEALMGVTGGGGNHTFRRDRFESWGGMSDISMSGGMGSENAVALAHSALYHTGLLEDLTAAADSAASSISESERIPSRISLTSLNRKFSIGGLSEATSVGLTNPEKGEMSTDIHAFVAAAMASVGDQLAGLAGDVEAVAGDSLCGSVTSEMLREETESDASSTTSTLQDIRDEGGRPRSWSTSSRPISVDYDAVQAAVDAAESATAALDLTAIASMAPPPSGRPRSDSVKKSARKLPLQKNRQPGDPSYPPLPPSVKSERDMEAIRARARAAAGYIPPTDPKDGQHVQLIKKRVKRPESAQTPQSTYSSCETPGEKGTPHTIYTPAQVPIQTPSSVYTPATPASAMSTASKASSQKWDEMYECLVEFVESRRQAENKGASEKTKSEWEWDGNVPTTYKVRIQGAK
jgi:hypothetical protein